MAKYVITDLAGDEVAGMKNPGVGQTIELSDLQAEQPLRIGHVKLETSEPAKPSRDRSE